ncbi:MFS transporter [Corallococcus sp. Z5C101001]|uniref:MFS transporter n=1 Tax=Corallococcus sp. Z5C101001 TaxID=2596829 RepID=UPI0011801BB4|nr:MFS transporter [Corallococcus sp. Z5C101001]TSC34430.1 MFS transporter [Corallococcus sp. Z5C101001]
MTSPPPSADLPSRRGDFRLLWAGQSLSLMGDQFAVVALPLVALEMVGTPAAQAALLPFALSAPFLVLGLPAGAIVDRLPRRLTMLVCDAVQAVAFAIIAALALLHALSFPVLMALVAISGCAVVFFQVAYTSYLPELLTRKEELHVGNSRLFFSESISRTIGPMAAGPVIAAFGAFVALWANALTFMASLVTLLAIRPTTVRSVPKPRERGWLVRDIREGTTFVFLHSRVEPVISCGVVYVLFLGMIEASLILYCKSVLGLSATGIGLVVGAVGIGFPLGNLLSARLTARFGVARSLVVSASVAVLGLVLTAAACSLGSLVGLVASGVIHGVGEGVFGPTSLTLRQLETPDVMLSRVNSVQRFFLWGAGSIGSLLAAGCIHLWGLPVALWAGGLGTVLCLPMLLRRGILQAIRQPHVASLPVAQVESPQPDTGA